MKSDTSPTPAFPSQNALSLRTWFRTPAASFQSSTLSRMAPSSGTHPLVPNKGPWTAAKATTRSSLDRLPNS